MGKVKMKWGRAILIALPFFAITIFWQAYDYVVPLMLSKHFSLSTTVYSLIMSIDNAVALIFLPLFGILSDRIRSKLGRRTPLILWGTIGGLIGLYVMNWADAGAVAGKSTFVVFMIALCAAVFFMSLYRSPAAALVADCFIRPHRTKANAALNVVGALAGVIFSIVGRKLIVSQDGVIVFTKAIYFVIIGMLVPSIVYFLAVRENKYVSQMERQNRELGLIDEKTDTSDKTPTKLTKDEKKSLFFILGIVFFLYMGYNAYNTHYTNYLVNYLQMPASWTTPYLMRVLLVTLFMVPAAMLASKIGRKKSAIIGTIFCAIGYLGSFTVTPVHVNMLYVWFLMIAIGFPLVSINLGPMVLELGKDSDAGRYMGYYYIAATVSQIVTPTIASFFINALGFQIIGVYAGVFAVVACVCGFFVHHGDAKPMMVSAVDEAVSDG